MRKSEITCKTMVVNSEMNPEKPEVFGASSHQSKRQNMSKWSVVQEESLQHEGSLGFFRPKGIYGK